MQEELDAQLGSVEPPSVALPTVPTATPTAAMPDVPTAALPAAGAGTMNGRDENNIIIYII